MQRFYSSFLNYFMVKLKILPNPQAGQYIIIKKLVGYVLDNIFQISSIIVFLISGVSKGSFLRSEKLFFNEFQSFRNLSIRNFGKVSP